MWDKILFLTSGLMAGSMVSVDIVLVQHTSNSEAQQMFMSVVRIVLAYRPFAETRITSQDYYQSKWARDYFQAIDG
jgi:hypothetical protein